MSNQRISFSKDGTARFISHLDLMRTLQRAFLRAGITIRHTEGFHPHPYISIPLPLPLGFSSECEILEFGLLDGASPETLPKLLNETLPSGITVHRCYEAGKPFRSLAFVRYEIIMEFESKRTSAAAAAFQELLSRDSHIITKRSKKAKSGQTQLDIIPLIHCSENLSYDHDCIKVQLLLHAQNPGLNPELLIGAFSDEYPSLAPSFIQFRRKALLDDAFQLYY